MDVFEDMRIFVGAVDLHGFTAAADKLGLSKQFVSRRVSALEQRLGVRLLTRTTRKLAVTDLGRIYYERAVQILADVGEADLAVSSQSGQPRGLLRVSAPMSFGTMHLGHLVPRFLATHPEVSLELDLNDRAVDIVGEGYDMAVRVAALSDSTLIARLIAPVATLLCCSPDYLARRGAPATPDELRHHDCILSSQSRSVEWLLSEKGKPRALPVSGRIRLNNGELARDAAIAGLGIAYLPRFIVADALARGQLLPLLEDYAPPPSGVYAVYPQHRQSSLLIRALTDFLVAAFREGQSC
jgi:DNA-binding transcriptional LysR family regulator